MYKLYFRLFSASANLSVKFVRRSANMAAHALAILTPDGGNMQNVSSLVSGRLFQEFSWDCG